MVLDIIVFQVTLVRLPALSAQVRIRRKARLVSQHIIISIVRHGSLATLCSLSILSILVFIAFLVIVVKLARLGILARLGALSPLASLGALVALVSVFRLGGVECLCYG